MNTDRRISVLIVDDSAIARNVIKRILTADSQIEVVGTAADGAEALELLQKVKPDVICTDLKMPVMNGLEFTRQATTLYAIPILVISISVSPVDDKENIFELLAAGAVDVFQKPASGLDVNSLEATQLRRKVRLVSEVRVYKRHKRTPLKEAKKPHAEAMPSWTGRIAAVAIGASTGGPQVLMKIFEELPEDFPPVLCAQHISQGFTESLIRWLDSVSSVKVVSVSRDLPLQRGHIYLPAEGYHLRLKNARTVCIDDGPPVHGHKPSVSVLFDSFAKVLGADCACVLLSGMGSDGADTIGQVHQMGGLTIAQNKETSVVHGMPGVAINAGHIKEVLADDEIAPRLISLHRRPGVNHD